MLFYRAKRCACCIDVALSPLNLGKQQAEAARFQGQQAVTDVDIGPGLAGLAGHGVHPRRGLPEPLALDGPDGRQAGL